MPAPKSKTTCNQCRARKVRCDGGPCPCATCKRLDFECSFDDSGTSTVTPSSVPDRRRVARACRQCRSLKSKCTGELPACAGCRTSGKVCVYGEPRKAARRHETSSPASQQPSLAISPAPPAVALETPDSAPLHGTVTSPRSSRYEAPNSCSSTTASKPDAVEAHPLPSLRDRLHLVVDFFRHVYPIPFYSFLYEEATVQRCLEETIDEALIYSICAISALLLGYSKYHPAATSAWATKVENMIWTNLEQPTIFKIQALVLVIQYRIVTGNFQRAFLLFSLAARSATALRLTYERTDLSPLAQEIRRRLMWSLVLMDGHFAIGLPECELCPYETVHLRPPRPEEAFNADYPADVDEAAPLALDGIAESGLLAICIQQYRIRRDLLRLKRELEFATQPVPRATEIVDDFIKMLHQALPKRYATAELQRYAPSRWLTRYIAAHLAWHQCHCDAYRLFLSGYKESAPEVILSALPQSYIADAVASCLHHAQAIIAILHDVDALNPRLKVACNDLAICGYHASRIVLFVSRSPQNPPDGSIMVSDALEKAQSTLAIIKRSYNASVIVQLVTKELEVVIQSVMSGQDQGSRDSSDLDEETGRRQPRYARVAKQRQGLGAHSILRHARFLDDSARAAQRSGIVSTQAETAAEPGEDFQLPPDQPQATLGLQWQQSAAPTASFTTAPIMYELGPGQAEGLTHLPQGIFDSAPFGPDPWAWQQDGAGLNDWFMQTDGDYF